MCDISIHLNTINKIYLVRLNNKVKLINAAYYYSIANREKRRLWKENK